MPAVLLFETRHSRGRPQGRRRRRDPEREEQSGATTKGRAELQTLLEFLRPGDTLLITRIDRLARSIGDL
jgi:DNA invertase Pin-like site-specific DNA recombinase